MEGNRVYNCIKGHSFLYPQPKAISIESRGRAIHITRCRPPLASTTRCPFDDGYLQRSAPSPPSPPPKTSSPPGFPAVAAFRPSSDGYGFSSAMSETDETVHRVEEKGRLLHPDPDQMQREEGLILREWRRRGAFLQDPIIRRFAKMLSSLRRRGRKRNVEIKLLLKLNNTSKLFYEKGKLNCETNKLQTREREKLYLSNREKFHTNADKQYWKAIAKGVAAAVEISATEGQAAKPERLLQLLDPRMQLFDIYVE